MADQNPQKQDPKPPVPQFSTPLRDYSVQKGSLEELIQAQRNYLLASIPGDLGQPISIEEFRKSAAYTDMSPGLREAFDREVKEHGIDRVIIEKFKNMDKVHQLHLGTYRNDGATHFIDMKRSYEPIIPQGAPVFKDEKTNEPRTYPLPVDAAGKASEEDIKKFSEELSKKGLDFQVGRDAADLLRADIRNSSSADLPEKHVLGPPGPAMIVQPVRFTDFVQSDAYKALPQKKQEDIMRYAQTNKTEWVLHRTSKEPDRFYLGQFHPAGEEGSYISINHTYDVKRSQWVSRFNNETFLLPATESGEVSQPWIDIINRADDDIKNKKSHKRTTINSAATEYVGPLTVQEFMDNVEFENKLPAQLRDALEEKFDADKNKNDIRIFARSEADQNNLMESSLKSILVGHMGTEKKAAYIDEIVTLRPYITQGFDDLEKRTAVKKIPIVRNGDKTNLAIETDGIRPLSKASALKLHNAMGDLATALNMAVKTSKDKKAEVIGPLNVTRHVDQRPGDQDEFMRTTLYHELWETDEGRKKIDAIYAVRDASKFDRMLIITTADSDEKETTRVLFGSALKTPDAVRQHPMTGEDMHPVMFQRSFNTETDERGNFRPFELMELKTRTSSPNQIENLIEHIRDAVNRRVIGTAPEKNPLFDQLLAKGPSAAAAEDTSVMAPVIPMVGDKKLSVA